MSDPTQGRRVWDLGQRTLDKSRKMALNVFYMHQSYYRLPFHVRDIPLSLREGVFKEADLSVLVRFAVDRISFDEVAPGFYQVSQLPVVDVPVELTSDPTHGFAHFAEFTQAVHAASQGESDARLRPCWVDVSVAVPADGAWCWVWHKAWPRTDPPVLIQYMAAGGLAHWWADGGYLSTDQLTHWTLIQAPAPPSEVA